MTSETKWWLVKDKGHWPFHWTRPPLYLTAGDAGPTRPLMRRWEADSMKEFRLRPHP